VVWWSDHWAFWRHGYPAIMITDTAPYRNVFYHTADDTPDTLDYPRMARVVDGLTWVVRELAAATR
jgi:Zn-dependent M28 family amino/carboxypeptidase